MNGTLKLRKTEVIEMANRKIKRYPNLTTVLMVEDFLQKHRDIPLKLSEVKRSLPKKIMHQTLQVVLEYLWKSGKVLYGPRGIQWIYSEPSHLKSMFEDTLEI